jgi:large subunit ribosomal protein L3
VAAILGKKLGMTQIFREDGSVVPVTVVEAGPCKVTAVRNSERDGYSAVQLAFGEVKQGKLSKAEEGHLKKASAAPMRHLVEFRDEDLGAEEGPKVGDDVTVEGFEAGQKVKVAGISIGKGFQGGIKRHNFSRGPVSHGSHNVRAPGPLLPPGRGAGEGDLAAAQGRGGAGPARVEVGAGRLVHERLVERLGEELFRQVGFGGPAEDNSFGVSHRSSPRRFRCGRREPSL